MSDYKDMGRSRLIAEIEALSHWRDLALQFDNHRMEALWHLKRVLSDENQTEQAQAFLSKPPLSAGDIISERNQLKAENESLRADAERYRWLRDAKGLSLRSDGSKWTRSNGEQFIASHHLCAFDTSYAAFESLDEVIDAAISSPENP